MFDPCIECKHHKLILPDKKTCIRPGTTVVFNRFDTQRWVIDYGWYSAGGNRKVCGWYCYQECNRKNVKPVEEIDLYDIYLIQS